MARNADPESGEQPFESDLADLQSFVFQVRELLQAVVDDGRHIPPDHHQDVREAWSHAKGDLAKLANSLASNTEETYTQLKLHGLTGASLRMKLGLWRSRLFRFGRRMNRRWLRRLLRWSDTILGSLVDAMTLGAAGKEFKEAIENLLDDRTDE